MQLLKTGKNMKIAFGCEDERGNVTQLSVSREYVWQGKINYLSLHEDFHYRPVAVGYRACLLLNRINKLYNG